MIPVTFPLWFKIYLGLFVVTIILVPLLHYTRRDKYILKYRELPEEKKIKNLESLMIAIKICKLFLWASPIYLIVLPFLCYKYVKQDFFYVTVLMIIVVIIDVIMLFDLLDHKKLYLIEIGSDNITKNPADAE